MKAVVQDRYGPADVLRLADVDTPSPGDGEVLVRVHAAGVDYGVWHLMAGMPLLVRAAIGLRAPRNPVRGRDVARTVAALGPGVAEFEVGDEVFGICEGSFAEYACVPVRKCVPKPANLTFEQAAALPVSGLTALHGLRGAVRAGDTVVITGAGGGVGTFAVQLAKAYGATVTGVCSTGKVDLVRSLGADDVVDYTRTDFADGTRQWDLVFDIAGLRKIAHLRKALTPRGRLILAGGEGGGRWLGGLDRTLRAILLSPFVSQRLGGLISTEPRADIEELRALAEAGTLTPVVDRAFPLADTAAAVRHLTEGRARGKVVVTV
ncbi:NAD(P)-dependent alcohol dehydrogenase [Actinophytocola sp. KF-1]